MKKTLLLLSSLLFMVSCSSSDDSYINKEEKVLTNKIVGDNFNLQIKETTIIQPKSNYNLEEKGFTFTKNGKEIYAVPFKNNKNKYFVYDDNLEIILENNVNEKGNGDIYITSQELTTIKTFDKGVLTNVSKKGVMILAKNGYRSCFDQAYDDVCDNFVGCLAWYSNPTVPIAAAIYCAF